MCRPRNPDLLKVYRMAERGMALEKAYAKVRDDGGDPGSWGNALRRWKARCAAVQQQQQRRARKPAAAAAACVATQAAQRPHEHMLREWYFQVTWKEGSRLPSMVA